MDTHPAPPQRFQPQILRRRRDLIVDSEPLLAWSRADLGAAVGLSQANAHEAPFARPLLELAARLLGPWPRVIRLDAAAGGSSGSEPAPHPSGTSTATSSFE